MAGRKRLFSSKKKLEEKINEYFKKCEGEVLKDKDGDPIYDKYGNPVIIGQKPPTVTGLALALGFKSRQSLLNYQDTEEFFDTITRAKMVIEEYNERRLYDREGVNGAKFNLINNFKGWSDKSELEYSEKPVIICDDIPEEG